jgi:hypothetical protein
MSAPTKPPSGLYSPEEIGQAFADNDLPDSLFERVLMSLQEARDKALAA